ncbi:hypothetical protein DPMN_190289 [Dreissena polymorpha]|uniref:Uncharacterized protein n=1 Tax=Dreissena polymorpha TaxID=45954 RepID=A0A9D4IA92_DREPO|nr:hypothetical protein DPMN_190289 [Dreissena polymorpha]
MARTTARRVSVEDLTTPNTFPRDPRMLLHHMIVTFHACREPDISTNEAVYFQNLKDDQKQDQWAISCRHRTSFYMGCDQ